MFFLERPSVIGSEKQLCDDLKDRLKEHPDWKIQRVSNNLILRRSNPDATRPKVVFAGHLDTVPEPREPITVRVEDDRVYGRGASDMKAGDATMLALLENFDWTTGWAEPMFVFYEREEGPYAENGLETVFVEAPDLLEAELAVVPEPTAGALEVGCVGTAQVEITFTGKSSHSARPWQGENAVTKAGEFLAALHERAAEQVMVDGLPFYEVLTPTLARGGETKNIVPDSFWINVNHRFAPGRDREYVNRLFKDLVGDTASYEIVDFAPSGPVDLDNPHLQRLMKTGLEVRPKQAWTDVARFAGHGVAAVNYGPGLPAQAHQENEHAELELLVECHERLENFLKGQA